MPVPHAEIALPLLPEVPLIGESFACRFQGQRQRIAKVHCLVGRLGGDDGNGLYRDGNGIGLLGVAGAVLNDAIELNAVPRRVGRDCFAGVGSAAPESKG